MRSRVDPDPLSCVPIQAREVFLSADFSVHTGTIRSLHGINKGPLAPGGIFELIQEQKELGIPFTRLHDCGWPNPYVVDHHAVFPNPKADPTLPESYDFRLTDEYISAVRKTGAEPIYRLGESIEHTSVKRVRPSACRHGKMGGGLPRHHPALQRRLGRTDSITTSAIGKSGTNRRTARPCGAGPMMIT